MISKLMLLSPDSPLRHPPKLLKPEQVVPFNAIRYSIDICSISYKRLLDNLTTLADKGTVGDQDLPEVFLDVWSIINNSVIFRNVLCRSFRLSFDEPSLNEISKAKKLRNTNQHLDERVKEILAIEDLPVYGSLSWLRIHPQTQRLVQSVIYSGSFTNKTAASISISGRKVHELHEEIQRIEFTGVIQEGKKGNYSYRTESIFINTIMSELTWWVAHIESQMEEQFKGHAIADRHSSDFLVQLDISLP